MKNLKTYIIALVAILTMTMSASAQCKFGLKVGMNVNSVNVDDLKSNLDPENRTGFSGGLMLYYNMTLGFALDLSAMYVHRLNEFSNDNVGQELQEMIKDDKFRQQDYLEIPLHLRYELSLPGVSSVLVPVIYTGPSVSFLCSKQAITDAYKARRFDTAWDLGATFRLFKHLEIGASYSWGINEVLERTQADVTAANLGKRNTWAITAAYLF